MNKHGPGGGVSAALSPMRPHGEKHPTGLSLVDPGRASYDGTRRRSNHYDPPAGRRDIECTGYSVAACQPQFPQFPLQVLHMWLARAFQTRSANALGKPKEPRLHVRRKGRDLGSDSLGPVTC
jgi:hypothetical protein